MDLSCHNCDYEFDHEDLFGDPEDISCPSCGCSTAS